MERRLIWIDYAKAFGILLVIINHTILSNSFGMKFIQDFISSFNMPLFFILSGITFKSVNSIENLLFIQKKEFKKLIIPCVWVVVFFQEILFLFGIQNIFETIVSIICTLIFQQPYVYPIIYFSSYVKSILIGPVWFLVCLFFSKTFVRMLELFIKNNYLKCFFYVLLCILGVVLGKTYPLPLCLDIVLVAMLFLKIGYSIGDDISGKFNRKVIILFFVVWMLLVFNGIRIEMGIRRYDYFLLGIIGSICGSICVLMFIKWFANRYDGINILKFIGSNSLIILCVHSIDNCFDWTIIINLLGSRFLFVIIRIFYNIGIAAIIVYWKERFKLYKNKLN